MARNKNALTVPSFVLAAPCFTASIIFCQIPGFRSSDHTAAEITAILKDSAHKSGKCVVIVTHSNELAKEADVVFRLRKGDLQISDTSEIEQERKKK